MGFKCPRHHTPIEAIDLREPADVAGDLDSKGNGRRIPQVDLSSLMERQVAQPWHLEFDRSATSIRLHIPFTSL
jgi:hypothetical protein